jgi:hypothetical protein
MPWERKGLGLGLGMERQGNTRHGKARYCMERKGKAWKGKARQKGKEWSRIDMARHGKVRSRNRS